jgi:hypothetical protein
LENGSNTNILSHESYTQKRREGHPTARTKRLKARV